jgi:tRNA(adenine34) deaminase
MTEDKQYMQRCIELAEAAIFAGELPFGSIIANDEGLVCEANNTVLANSDVTQHAEINVMRAAQGLLGNDLSGCTLYSNCEPCAMCSFMICELKLRRVVFAVKSPDMGGYTRWDILNDSHATALAEYGVVFPDVEPYFMQEEASKTFVNFERRLLGLPYKNNTK